MPGSQRVKRANMSARHSFGMMKSSLRLFSGVREVLYDAS
jgi:hypothetical protein